MGNISLRLPDSLHEQVRRMAEKEHVSINQVITLALAEKLSALMTEEYLASRSARASRAKFDLAMAQIQDVEPEECDRF